MERPSRPTSSISSRAAETSRSRVNPFCSSGLKGSIAHSPLDHVVALAFLTALGLILAPACLTPLEKGAILEMDEQRWSAWSSPVGLGLFFVLIAVAVEIVRFAFK